MRSWLECLIRFQIQRPGTIVLVAALCAVAAIPLVARLHVDGRFAALLPEDAPSVRDLEAARSRVQGLETLTLAVRSPSGNVTGMERLADVLAPRLEQLPGVVHVDFRVGAYAQFVREHLALYATSEQLDRLNSALQERLDEGRARANPFYVALDEDTSGQDELDEVLNELEAERDARSARFPDGYYLSADRHALVLFVRSDLSGGESIGSRELVRRVRRAADAALEQQAGDLNVAMGGSVKVAMDEAEAIGGELVLATLATIVSVLLAILFFFRTGRAIVLLGGALVVPVLVTFAYAAVAVGALNTSTAFLASIVIGNGVNPNIIWLSRFFEERRAGQALDEAVRRTHVGVFVATATASGAAAIAYLSLIVTDFRGFHDFGVIGFVGMALSWLGAIVLLPALTILWGRRRPLQKDTQRGAASYGRLFATVAARAPRTVVWVSVLLSLAAAWAVCVVAHDPMEYDFRRLSSDRAESEAKRVTHLAHDIVGDAAQGNGMVMLAPSVREERRLRGLLQAQTAQHDLFGRIRSLDDLLPQDAAKKLPKVRRLRELMLELRPLADAQTRERINAYLPDADLRVLTLDDLPEEVARRYTERDGVRGRALIVTANTGHSLWDGRYLVRWTEAMRRLRLANGERPLLLGRGPVFADVLQAIGRDGGRAVVLSLLATLALLAIAFRGKRAMWSVMLGLGLGVLWMAGAMGVLGMKLNFLDFVAFPITFGNGADYGVNVMQRYLQERKLGSSSAMLDAVRSSGGAVTLCSFTTVLGYGSLFISANRAVRSFGGAMVISEITCLCAAVLTVPALTIWLSRRRTRSQESGARR
ncbi:MAG: MMPL family transporter [Deltaproteobacteria bacterium]|nr:MMPL family transporter [Deltaproteobacteria bacterium]